MQQIWPELSRFASTHLSFVVFLAVVVAVMLWALGRRIFGAVEVMIWTRARIDKLPALIATATLPESGNETSSTLGVIDMKTVEDLVDAATETHAEISLEQGAAEAAALPRPDESEAFRIVYTGPADPQD